MIYVCSSKTQKMFIMVLFRLPHCTICKKKSNFQGHNCRGHMNFHPETPQTQNSKAPTNPCKCKSMYLKVANEKGKSLWGFFFISRMLYYYIACLFQKAGIQHSVIIRMLSREVVNNNSLVRLISMKLRFWFYH